jgi:hypothetical protein
MFSIRVKTLALATALTRADREFTKRQPAPIMPTSPGRGH